MKETALDEFSVRYYQWSIDSARRELLSGFPMVRLIKGTPSLRFIAYLELLNKKDREILTIAFAKRGHTKALELLGRSLDGEEKEAIATYLNVCMKDDYRYFEEYCVRKKQAGGIDKKKLKLLIIDRLNLPCGKIWKKYSTFHWSHKTACQGWFIETEIEIRQESPFQLKYGHQIVSPAGEPLRVSSGIPITISLLGWIGIFHSEWNLLVSGEENAAAESLEIFCQHFLKSAPVLLAGLQP